MGAEVPLLFLLLLLCASDGWTQSTNNSATGVSVTPSSGDKTKTCRQREGTSVTVLMDAAFSLFDYSFIFRSALAPLSARFPCITRRYTTLLLDYADTNETSTADKNVFLSSLKRDYDYSYFYNHIYKCNQSLLYGLKRALQLSPPESVLVVFTFGSMSDYNDSRLLSDVYNLLQEKKLPVYFVVYPNVCPVYTSQAQIFKNISLQSYGELTDLGEVLQLIRSLKLLLAKPINVSRQALSIKVNVPGNFKDKFNLTTSLTHLLITRDSKFNLNLTDPSGKVVAFSKLPSYVSYSLSCRQTVELCRDLHQISSHLVSKPTSGSWTLNILGNGSFSAQIFGFAELNQPGNCSDCHPDASCVEFGGYGECTCKEGFSGDGYTCQDIDECQDEYICWWYGSCVNTVGSYTCNCSSGFLYVEGFGCDDIDECADPSLNDCHPLAECSNYLGYYMCRCRNGYEGDGKHCKANECQQGALCNSVEDCINYNGSYTCVDPCAVHTVLNDTWRSTNNSYGYHCDYFLHGWYRFKGEYDLQIPEDCIPPDSCGTQGPMWMNGRHPAASEGIVNRTACASWYEDCCYWSTDIPVKMCPGGFYVYKLSGTPFCNLAYCTDVISGNKTQTCTQREGTSVTVLMDAVFSLYGYSSYFSSALGPLSARFPCVTRQYTSVLLDYADTYETSTADKNVFLSSLQKTYSDYPYFDDHMYNCNQSLLYGLKRALQLSPPESVLVVLTSGSMSDYNDSRLLSDVYNLLQEKRSPVYFMVYPNNCPVNTSQAQIFKNISLRSYGELTDYRDVFPLMRSLERLLAKPINVSRQALSIKVNVTGSYKGKFNLTTSLTHLLIARDAKFRLNLTDPSGNVVTFSKLPAYPYVYIYCSQTFELCQDLHIISSHLVSNPMSGSWALNVLGNGSFAAQIFGFAELNQPGNCSDCHPDASCEEFGGYGECTCKEGFSGDGYKCRDIDECRDYYSNKCSWYGGGSCVNTVGSYTCNCYNGYQYDEMAGCADIDECADPSLNNCHPLADCINYEGFYTCTCPYGYYGDGQYCEVNECLQGTPCQSTEECIKYRGFYYCMDPCSSHIVLNDPWRNINNTNGYMYNCDSYLQGWYQFKGDYDQQIPEYCVPSHSCGTQYPMWMNGRHPAASEGIVKRTACASGNGECCMWSRDISVKMCPGGFYVYKLSGTPGCYYAYCTENTGTGPTTTNPSSSTQATARTFTTKKKPHGDLCAQFEDLCSGEGSSAREVKLLLVSIMVLLVLLFQRAD